MRLGHDGLAIKAAGRRYERDHRRKSGGRSRSATVISPPAIFMTIRASLMRQARTMSAPKPRREISVAIVTPSLSRLGQIDQDDAVPFELIKCGASRVVILARPEDTLASVVLDRDDELRLVACH